MKTLKNLVSIFVLFTSLSFVSCENEPIDPSLVAATNNPSNPSNGGGNGSGGGNTSNYYIKTKIDGVQKEWTGLNAGGVLINNGMLSILGMNGNNAELTLLINNSTNGAITTGNYPYQWALTNAIYINNGLELTTGYSDFTVSPGGITITEINTTNKTVKGTFTFVGKNDGLTISKNFTDGNFFVRYQ